MGDLPRRLTLARRGCKPREQVRVLLGPTNYPPQNIRSRFLFLWGKLAFTQKIAKRLFRATNYPLHWIRRLTDSVPIQNTLFSLLCSTEHNAYTFSTRKSYIRLICWDCIPIFFACQIEKVFFERKKFGSQKTELNLYKFTVKY